MRRWSRWWWGAGLALLAAAVLARSLAPAWGGTTLLTVLLVLWGIPSTLFGLFRLWRRLTYRIGVRLLISYVLIGVMPFVLMLAVAALGGYILIGQYCSVRYADLIGGVEEEMLEAAGNALEVAETAAPEAARAVLAESRTFRAVELPRVEWILATPAGTWTSPGAGWPSS